MTDVAQADFVAEMADWRSHGALQWIVAIVAIIIVWLASSGAGEGAAAKLGGCGFIAFVLARYIEKRRRRVCLDYQIEAAEAESFERLGAAWARLAVERRLFSIEDGMVRHAGGAPRLRLRRNGTPQLLSNVNPWTLGTKGLELVFLPDRLVIVGGKELGACSYHQLEVSTSSVTIPWLAEVPEDAEVVGKTWVHVRADGEKDRRYSDNPEVPEVKTEALHLTSTTGLDVKVYSTDGAAIRAVEQELRCIFDKAREERKGEEQLAAARAELGFSEEPTLEDLEARYLERTAKPSQGTFSLELVTSEETARVEKRDEAYQLLKAHLESAAATDATAEGARPQEQELVRPQLVAPAWGLRESCATAIAGFGALMFIIVDPERDLGAAAAAQAQPVMPVAAVPAENPWQEARTAIGRVVVECPLRSKPSSKAKQLVMLAKGRQVDILEEKAGWKRVRSSDGEQGWTGPRCWQSPRVAAKRRGQVAKGQVASNEAAPIAPTTPIDPYETPAHATPPLEGAADVVPVPKKELTAEDLGLE